MPQIELFFIVDIKLYQMRLIYKLVVIAENYAKSNLRRLQNDFPTLKNRITIRLVPYK